MSRVKEGLKFAHPTFFDLLELVELEYKVFISKVQKYNKPSMLEKEKIVEEKEISPIANYSSDYRNKTQESDRNRNHRNKAQDSDRNWKPEQRRCYACGSTKHF